ncbi:O-antigen ligase [Sphingomonas sp. 67-41]|uniref:O-antigen ligase family protein n=1 Tax=Sphingomonas TaxID=13687 RepID=UPI00257EB245|nr:O-antigen ligase family protein [Sphingomonas sp. 67-41]
MSGFLFFVFLLGGGSRDDIGSLVILRPVAVIACGYALWTLNADTARHYRAALAIAVAGMVLVVMQLVPLPPAVWTTLPGHGIVSDIDRTAGLGALWRPWTMSPTGTWNALFALFVPLAALLLGIQLPREDQFRLLGVIGGLGLLSALVGLLQTLGPANGPLYFYQITNNGFAVGLFANRNHAATLLACIFPMLAVYASIERSAEVARFRSWAALMLAAALLPLILVTGSRAGLLLSVIGLGLAALLHRRPSAPGKGNARSRYLIYLLVGLALAGIVALFALSSRAPALQRLFTEEPGEEFRIPLWSTTLATAMKYFPMGSGFGSFSDVFQIDEPDSMLVPTYANHAHNDWLELLMTGGLPAVLLFAAAFLLLCRWSLRAWRSGTTASRETQFARLGSAILLLLAAASIGDYPLRVPSLACLAAVAIIWLHGAPQRASRSVHSLAESA